MFVFSKFICLRYIAFEIPDFKETPFSEEGISPSKGLNQANNEDEDFIEGETDEEDFNEEEDDE
jgi:hypothetical protein